MSQPLHPHDTAAGSNHSSAKRVLRPLDLLAVADVGLQSVMHFLSATEITQMATACSRLYHLVDHPFAWRHSSPFVLHLHAPSTLSILSRWLGSLLRHGVLDVDWVCLSLDVPQEGVVELLPLLPAASVCRLVMTQLHNENRSFRPLLAIPALAEKLEWVEARWDGIGFQTMQQLTRLPHLTHLRLLFAFTPAVEVSQCTALLSMMGAVTELVISSNVAGSARAYANIATCPQLRRLRLTNTSPSVIISRRGRA